MSPISQNKPLSRRNNYALIAACYYIKFLIKLSKEYGVKCVVQNDSHYYLKEHWEAHQVLLCKNTGSKLNNPKFTFGSKEYYLKNETEVLEIFDEYMSEIDKLKEQKLMHTMHTNLCAHNAHKSLAYLYINNEIS